MTFVRDGNGRPVSVLGVSRDIHQRKLAEEEKARLEKRLQEAQRMEAIASLAGGIAHQFNNALSVILGRIDMLELKPVGERELEIEPIKLSAERMVQLTNQLLAYARGGRYQARVVPAEHLVKQTLALIEHLVPPSIHVETDIQSGTSAVKADETQFQMAFSAVIFNAVEAIEGEGRIRISCRNETVTPEDISHHPELETGPYVLLRVEDNGKGMDEETGSRIFEPFFTTKFQGRGLGMAAAYGVIRNHDGWITVDSEPERGTTVRIHLPASEEAAEIAPKERSSPKQRFGTALVVEDEDMVMDVSRAMLEELGYRVLPAQTGEEALRLGSGHEGTIDLALLDLKLPDMDAKQVYHKLVELRPGLKVIVYSGFSLEGPAQEILNAGADAFLQKPFSLEALSGKIDKIL
jgi:nitrogen-specific signal transduction histidine kinase